MGNSSSIVSICACLLCIFSRCINPGKFKAILVTAVTGEAWGSSHHHGPAIYHIETPCGKYLNDGGSEVGGHRYPDERERMDRLLVWGEKLGI